MSRHSSEVEREEEDDRDSNTPLPTHSATLFPRGSLRPKFIARGNAPPCFYTLLPDLSPLYPPLISITTTFILSLSLSSPSSSISRYLFFPLHFPFFPIDRQSRTIPENIKCLPGLLRTRGFASSISRLNCSSTTWHGTLLSLFLSLPPPYWPLVAQFGGTTFLLLLLERH